MGSDGNYYAGDTHWHSDGWHPEGRLHMKIAIYLDPLTRDTGALRVIPGSHRIDDRFAQEVNSTVSKPDETLGIAPRDMPAVALDNTPGDVCAFDHNTKHASFGGSGFRRMFTINLSRRYPADQTRELRDYVGHFARFWAEKPYGPEMIRTASAPRMRHLEQLLANSDHLPALVAEARKKMAEPSRG
jgi:ectoine hydroxylase-related dioxygenase (phytanoyl-CoA dioxygenase family)